MEEKGLIIDVDLLFMSRHRANVDRLARYLGINPENYPSKWRLCCFIARMWKRGCHLEPPPGSRATL